MIEIPTYYYTAAGGVVVTDDTRQVLVLWRPGRQGPDGRLEVRLPKGHVEPGESDHEAALREVREEAGLASAAIVADLGYQRVEFGYEGRHVIRNEHYYLMAVPAGTRPQGAEPQFEPLWLPWEEALHWVTFEAEREWLRRARAAVDSW